MLRNSLVKYQKAVKYCKASYFASIIANNSPCELFTVSNRHLCPSKKLTLAPSLTTSKLFAISAINLSETNATELCFNQYETMLLSEVHDIIFAPVTQFQCTFLRMALILLVRVFCQLLIVVSIMGLYQFVLSKLLSPF